LAIILSTDKNNNERVLVQEEPIRSIAYNVLQIEDEVGSFSSFDMLLVYQFKPNKLIKKVETVIISQL
jgi:hypothetical protein